MKTLIKLSREEMKAITGAKAAPACSVTCLDSGDPVTYPGIVSSCFSADAWCQNHGETYVSCQCSGS